MRDLVRERSAATNVWRALLAALLVLLPASTLAEPSFPKFTGFVVDAADILPPDIEADLTQKLDALQRDTKRQLIVATVPETGGYPLEEYGYRLGRAWGVGLKDVDNGAILFVAPGNPAGQRGPRIEVGYGLEPILTDALSSQIINGQMMPLIREGQIPQAMVAGTDAIVAQLRASPEEAQARVDAAVADFDRANAGRRSRGGGGFPIGLVFWGVMLVFVLIPMFSGGRRGRRYRGGAGSALTNVALWTIANEIGRSAGRSGGGWGGGGGFGGGGGGWGGGGFSGGGGGGFGGGGASGSW